MPTIDPTTPSGVQPVGFSSGFTLIMSDEFNGTGLDSKWNPFKDFGDYSAPSGNWDVNSGNNSLLRMWYNGQGSGTSSNAADDLEFGTNGANPWRGRFGYYECRAKCIRGRGLFPGFWLYPLSNSNGENGCGSKQEVDIVEWFSYENGDWLVDTSAFRCKNAVFTVWENGGGGCPTNQAGNLFLGHTRGYDNTISTQHHVYGMYWASTGGLRWYYDGVHQGTINDPWGSGNNMQLVVFLQLWWGSKGGNPVPDGNTPQGSGNSMEFDYVRVWSIAGSPAPAPPGPPPPVFAASVTTAPNDGATIAGLVNLVIDGSEIKNAELLPSTGYTPSYGTFTLSNGGAHGELGWDTAALANGTITVRISAFDQAAGVSPANEIVAMAARTWTINNAPPPPPFSASLTTAPSNGAILAGTVNFQITGSNIRNAELLPPTAYSPIYGTFVVQNNDTFATLNWDTTALPDGSIDVRVIAYNQPFGVTPANEIVVMPSRSYTIDNVSGPPPAPPPPPPPAPPPPPGPDMEFCSSSLFWFLRFLRRGRR